MISQRRRHSGVQIPSGNILAASLSTWMWAGGICLRLEIDLPSLSEPKRMGGKGKRERKVERRKYRI